MKKKGFDLPMNNPYNLMELIGNLNKKQFALKDIGVTARVHNAWRSAGIIPYAEADGKWANYDFVQYLWLQMVKDLREFGLPLEALAHIKNILFREFKDADKEDIAYDSNQLAFLNSHFLEKVGLKLPEPLVTEENIVGGMSITRNLFQGCVLNHFVFRTNTVFYVYIDGFVDVWSDYQEKLQPELNPSLDEPYVALPLQHYFAEFLSDETKAEFLTSVPVLSYEEKEVLQAMRNKQLKELTIKFIQDGKSRRMDVITKEDGLLTEEETKQITRILSLKNYQNINLKKHNGSKLYFEHEKRQKL